VVIPVFNGEKFIGQALESVFSQTYKDFEVICIDDGSSDGSPEVIAQYGGKVRYFRQENAGPSSARNAAMNMSRGEFIAFLDQDDLWYPDKLRLQMDYLKRHPDVAMVHSNINISRDDVVIHHGLPIERRQNGSSVFEELYLGNFINSITVVARRKIFDIIGLFDEDFRMAQDYDLWMRIASRFKIAYQDEIMAEYRLHDNNSSRNNIAVIKDDLNILYKMRSLYPSLVSSIPVEKVRKRYFTKYYMQGYAYFCQHDLRNARMSFLKSLKYKKMSIRSYIYVLSTYFPRETIDRIRNIKRKVQYLSIRKA
jgi:glycosyltransferase involved in cell wall biosynthesis